jgi:hypothetical protein
MADVYEALREHLDSLPAGFPATESGVEIRILKRLFSPEEAELARHLRARVEQGGTCCGHCRAGQGGDPGRDPGRSQRVPVRLDDGRGYGPVGRHGATARCGGFRPLQAGTLARRGIAHKVEKGLCTDCRSPPIQNEKDFHRCVPDSLVAVNEGMIHHHRKTQ